MVRMCERMSVAVSRVLLACSMATVIRLTGMAGQSMSGLSDPVVAYSVPKAGSMPNARKMARSPAAWYFMNG